MAAAGISAQGINVPPPVHIAAICPSAVNVAVPWPSAVPKRLAMEPASDIPEKPEGRFGHYCGCYQLQGRLCITKFPCQTLFRYGFSNY
ncbi:Transporter [Bacillus cereus]|nr:Transporter [Bacillus cereus]